MGNALIFKEWQELPGPKGVDFFKTLQFRWVLLFFDKVKASGLREFSLEEAQRQRLSWRVYFQVFSEIKEEMERDEDRKYRAIWHPSTTGFIMRPGALPDFEPLPRVKRVKGIPEDFTDDDASDESEEEEDEEGEGGEKADAGSEDEPDEEAAADGDEEENDGQVEEKSYSPSDKESGKGKKEPAGRPARRKSWIKAEQQPKEQEETPTEEGGRVRKKWDPATRSPIFFGYHDTTTAMRDAEKLDIETKNIDAEQRAVARARDTRSSLLDNVQKVCEAQAKEREDKIREIENKYKAATARREKELNEKKKELPETAFKVFKRQWDSEYDAAEASYEAEVGQLKFTHHVKSNADEQNLSKRRAEMEAFKDAEAQEVPAAERLEEIARIEISRWIDALEEMSQSLEKAQLEYHEMREELEYVQSKSLGTNAKKNEKQLRELKAVVNHAESLVREKQRNLQDTLVCLSDAEALLDKAIRIKKQQDELLPLFSLLAKEPTPSSCLINFFAVSFAILMNGSYEQKCNFIFNLFDVAGEGFFNSTFLKLILILFQETFYRLYFIPVPPNVEEIDNLVWRAFLDLGLKPGTGPDADFLTQYEMRQMVVALVGQSAMLADAMGFSYVPNAPGARKSTFQRNRMSAVALLSRGMISPTIAKYRIHFETTKYWTELNPRSKASIHERSMSMGEGDPFRPDYSRFMQQQVKKRSSTIPPLTHGHLSYVPFIEDRTRQAAVIKIQAMLRAFRDRKVADLRARRQAFLDAKEATMKEMKSKVVKEFKKREASTGTAKMKWDAQVRMRQAKLRSLGQQLIRADTIILMMEEAISKAKIDIENRFKKLEEKESFATTQPNHHENPYLFDPSKSQDLQSLFGILAQVSVSASNLTEGEGPSAAGGPSALSLAKAYGGAEGGQGGEGEGEGENGTNPSPDASSNAQLLGSFNRARAQLAIEGKYHHESSAKGESLIETDLRIVMQQSEPLFHSSTHFNRLRAINGAMTFYKTTGIIAELPSKRLLVRYVEGMLADCGGSTASLAKELRAHFRFTRNYVEIAEIFQNLVSSDFERGLLLREVGRLQQILEPGMRQTVSRHLTSAVDVMETFLERKLSTNDTVSEHTLVSFDIERADKYVRKYRQEALAILNTIDRHKALFRRLQLSVLEVEKKQRIMYLLRDRRAGNRSGETDPVISIEDRQNWVSRLMTADRMAEATHEQKLAKYAEIRAVCREFLDTATADAVLIIAEHHLPKYRKTLPVAAERDVNGRSLESGRGLAGGGGGDTSSKGKELTYEAHNIVYTVASEDYNGVYNGSDEFAAKAAGLERLGALEYLKTHTHKLNVPPTAIIDYAGHRILAVAKIPTENVVFNDEGEVRKITEDQVYGTAKNGELFLNKHKTASNALKSASIRLNLAEHSCKGLRDIMANTTSASADIQLFYSKRDEEFYGRNFKHAFPPEHPEVTAVHLPRVPRDQSIFWRRLRPEFCRKYEYEQLSPDALCLITQRVEDRDKQNKAVELATSYLLKELIPSFVKELTGRKYALPLSEGLGLDLTTELHSRGINMRHLGLMRSMLWHTLPGTFSLFFGERMVRTSTDLRQEVLDGELLTMALSSNSSSPLLECKITVTSKRPDPPVTHPTGDKITSTSLPIDVLFMEKSKKGLVARAGLVPNHANNEDLRTVILGEMVARTIKHLIRLELRNYARKTKSISAQFINGAILEYLNMVTGAHSNTNYFMQELVYEGVRERFGPNSLRPSEKMNLHENVAPVAVYIVKRLQEMLGLQLSSHCLAEFFERPTLFTFCELDILEVAPKVRHSVPIMAYADASIVTLKAQEAMRLIYVSEVLEDKPVLFYRMYERKGARTAQNKGTLGAPGEFDGQYSRGMDLWNSPGPILADPFSKSARFVEGEQSFIDVKYHAKIVPQEFYDHFSIELFLRCTGGVDTTRYVVISGRYGIVISKEGNLTFVFVDGLYDVNVRFAPVVMEKWMHIVCTYDGTFLRCYVDGSIVITTEVEPPLRQKSSVFENEILDQMKELERLEASDAEAVLSNSNKQADAYFATKTGISFLKNETQNIMESEEFQALNIGANERNEQKVIQMKRTAALNQAKEKYCQDLCVKNMNEIKQRYRLKRDELDDKVKKKRDEGNLRIRTTLRLGAAAHSAGSRRAEHPFIGEMSCFSIFDCCLTMDRVRAHYNTALCDRTKDAQRLFSMASMKYEEALSLAPDDLSILQGFALSLTEYLKIEGNSSSSGSGGGSNQQGVSRGKLKVLEAIERFKAIGVPEGAAAILKAIPHDGEYAILVCRAFQAVKALDKYFFTRGLNMSRADLAHLPQNFGLDFPANPQEYIDTAAAIYSEVCRDTTLAFSYGETDVSWVGELASSELVIALLRHAREDKSLKLIQVGELFKSVGREKISITDDDVSILVGNSSLTVGFDFAGCALLTNQSLVSLSRSTNIRILSLESCVQLDDMGLAYLLDVAERLEVVNFSGVTRISDEGLAVLFKSCQRLQGISVNNCPQLTYEVLHVGALHSRKLGTLHASCTQITDGGLSLICSALSSNHMRSLDLSMCRDISDFGIMSVADSCPNLKFLNLSGLSRISDAGARAICAKCWYLESLTLEDVFLLDDDAFRYEFSYDGRIQADEHMLRHLVTLNLRDCVNVTDHGLQGLSERSRKIQTLILRGCDKITNLTLTHISNPFEDNFPLCDALRVLDLQFCSGITGSGILSILPHCGVLEELRVSGIVSINDEFVKDMCMSCKTIQRVVMQKCVFLSDAALCHMADFMWLEYLDVSGCHRITDDGIEVLTVACNGLFRLIASGLRKLTARAINSIARNCRAIQYLDVRQCPLITDQSIKDLLLRWPFLNLSR